MTTASCNDTNPFGMRHVGPKDTVSYILAHQPKSFDWRARGAKRHPWGQIPQDAFDAACETLDQIIDIVV